MRVVDFVILGPAKEKTMPAELPETVAAQLTMESVQAHQHIINESKGNIQSSNNIVRHVAAKKFDQGDAIESSAVEKVLKASS